MGCLQLFVEGRNAASFSRLDVVAYIPGQDSESHRFVGLDLGAEAGRQDEARTKR
jgi:hypothetical protein